MGEDNQHSEEVDDKDIVRLQVDGRELILVGTAHISQKSTDLVRKVIQDEKPDVVCVELDSRRYASLTNPDQWEKLDLKSIIRKKQLGALIAQLSLAGYQRRLGSQLGVKPGIELLEATKVADEMSIPFDLCDRDVGITLKRAWRKTPFIKQIWLMSSMAAGLFDRSEISEEQLEEIKEKDVLNEMLREVGEAMPTMKQVLIDERDSYLASKILASKGDKVVAIVGAGHVQGMVEHLEKGDPIDVAPLEEMPPASNTWKWIGALIPVLIAASLVWIGMTKGFDEAKANFIFWCVVNGVPCAVGGLIALAHPLTILGGLIAAPFTSLTPVIGAGYVTAFIQAWLSPPTVEELQSAGDDMSKPGMWWKNRLLKIFLAFLLPTLGSAIGTWVGFGGILKNLN